MSSTINGIGENEIVPTHEITLTRGADGLWTGSHVVRCRYVDYGNSAITNQINQGTPITSIDPNIPLKFSFIKVESHTFEHQPGGITRIRLVLTGSDADDGLGGGSGGTDRSTTYSFRGVTDDRSILEHPNYLAEVTDVTIRAAIAALYNGEGWFVDEKSLYFILSKQNDKPFGGGGISDANAKKWIDKIVAGARVYSRAQMEWSISQTNEGGMTQADLDSYNRRVTVVPGDPPKPAWADSTNSWWHFSDISEDRTGSSSSYDRTYTLRDDKLDADLYDYDEVAGGGGD